MKLVRIILIHGGTKSIATVDPEMSLLRKKNKLQIKKIEPVR